MAKFQIVIPDALMERIKEGLGPGRAPIEKKMAREIRKGAAQNLLNRQVNAESEKFQKDGEAREQAHKQELQSLAQGLQDEFDVGEEEDAP